MDITNSNESLEIHIHLLGFRLGISRYPRIRHTIHKIKTDKEERCSLRTQQAASEDKVMVSWAWQL